MDLSTAADSFGALAQESRLKIFRLLLRAGREGMAAGDIARKLSVPHNTLSVHLAVLSRAKLVRARKEGAPSSMRRTSKARVRSCPI